MAIFGETHLSHWRPPSPPPWLDLSFLPSELHLASFFFSLLFLFLLTWLEGLRGPRDGGDAFETKPGGRAGGMPQRVQYTAGLPHLFRAASSFMKKNRARLEIHQEQRQKLFCNSNVLTIQIWMKHEFVFLGIKLKGNGWFRTEDREEHKRQKRKLEAKGARYSIIAIRCYNYNSRHYNISHIRTSPSPFPTLYEPYYCSAFWARCS